MTIGSILLVLALFILVVLVLARPFLVSPPKDPSLTPHQRLLAQKEALLEQIRSLEFDFETGKLPEEAFHAQRLLLVQEAAVILQQVDHVTSQTNGNIEAEIETAVAQLRQSRSVPLNPRPITKSKGGYCPHCGRPVDPSDKFCASCGQKLSKQLSAISNQ